MPLVSGFTAVYASPSRPHNAIRVVQDHGVWWFQDGAGRRFFSLGVNCVGGCYGHAEETPLPPSRKQRIIAWLKDWGFNTAGAWSSPSLWDGLYFADQLLLEFSETQDDVFDEAFWADWLADRLRREVQPFLGRRHFLGYFLDNEREWKGGDLFAFYAGLPKGTPGSRAWLSFVARYYGGSLEGLNREWQTAYGSFDDIAGNGPRPPFSPAMQRGLGYRDYVQQAAQAPFVVGMHWFMWMDYSERDRGEDGYPHPPDQNVGLLSHGEGSVYEELTSWAAQTNAAVEAMPRAARWEPPAPPAPQRVVLAQFTPTVDGDIAEWPRELAVRPTHGQALLDDAPAGHTYFLAWDGDALYVAGDIADAHLQHPPGRWWQADFLAIELSPAEPTKPYASEPPVTLLFPTGGGPDAQQPYAAHKAGPRQLRPLAIEVAKRPRPGGYTIEARLPATAVAALASAPRPSSWHVTLTYQNVDGISQAQWEGIMTLE